MPEGNLRGIGDDRTRPDDGTGGLMLRASDTLESLDPLADRRRNGPLRHLAQRAGPETATDAVPDAAMSGRGGDPSPAARAGAERTPAPAQSGDEDTSIRWRLAPIRFGGALSTELRMETAQDQPRRLQQLELASIQAASYIWQPWFAQVSGGLGLITSRERTSGGSDGAVAPAPGSPSSANATGNANLSVFPTSRFPFQAYFDLSDSRASGDLAGSHYTNSRFGLRQNYRPADSNTNYSASYDRSTLTSNTFGRDTVDVLSGSVSAVRGVHGLDANGAHTRNRRENGEGSVLDRLSVRHSYRPDALMNVESLASYNRSDFRLGGDAPVSTATRFTQLTSFGTWRREEDDPLYLTGSARVFESRAETNGSGAESRSMNATVAGNYTYSPTTRFFGSAGFTHATGPSGTAMFSSQNLGASYSPGSITLAGFAWTWNASATVANQTGGLDGSRQNVGGQAGHTVTRSFALAPASSLSVTVAQNVGSFNDSVTGAATTLAHSGSVAWRTAPRAAMNGYVSFSAADSRTTGVNESHFQFGNVQASGQAQWSRYSFGSANVTLQATRQSTPANPDAGFRTTATGTVSYQHQRAFEIPRLRYSAYAIFNSLSADTRIAGSLSAPREQISESLEQRLEYSVGRVDFRLTARLARVDGRRNALIFFRMTRQFGAF